MNTEKQLVSLLEIAIDRKVTKSSLDYYVNKGLIIPEQIIAESKMRLFDNKSTNDILDSILLYKKKGLSLEEIKEKTK